MLFQNSKVKLERKRSLQPLGSLLPSPLGSIGNVHSMIGVVSPSFCRSRARTMNKSRFNPPGQEHWIAANNGPDYNDSMVCKHLREAAWKPNGLKHQSHQRSPATDWTSERLEGPRLKSVRLFPSVSLISSKTLAFSKISGQGLGRLENFMKFPRIFQDFI